MKFLVIQLLTILLSSYNSYCSDYSHNIYVSKEGSSDDISTCGSSNSPCSGLNLALLKVKYSSTAIYLYPGTYEFASTDRNELSNLSNFAIIGLSTTTGKDVEINCYHSGLSLSHMDGVVMKDITYRNCGTPRDTTNLNLTTDNGTYLQGHVAVYMLFCKNVLMSNVKWMDSNGIALTLYNTVGHVTIESCLFSGSHIEEGGGGGLLIEFTYCKPQDSMCQYPNVPTEYTSDAVYYVTNTSFINNSACRCKIFQSTLFRFSNQGKTSYNFGNGGGLAIILKGVSSRNFFQIDNCSFTGNKAHYGGAFYIGFFDNSHDNSVEITRSVISENHNHDIQDRSNWDIDANGGGGTIIYVSGIDGSNNVTIDNCIFKHNKGLSGGGLSVQAISNFLHLRGSLMLSNLVFDANSAYLGSAVYFFLDNTNCNKYVTVEVSDSNFTNNSPLCLDPVSRTLISLRCRGIVYSVTQKLVLYGNLNFVNNSDSSIEAHYTHIEVQDNTKLLFLNNTSRSYGPAISLFDCSYLKIFPETSLSFENNHAFIKGGAIYSGSCSGLAQTAILSSNCFITYYNFSVHPDNWLTEFIFDNNTAGLLKKPNVLYAESFTSCWTSVNNISHRVNFSEIFCWSSWIYKGKENCYNSISSGVSYMKLGFNNSLSVVPGDVLPHPVLYDGHHQPIQVKEYIDISSDFRMYVISGEGCFSRNDTKNVVGNFSKNHPKLYYSGSNVSSYIGTTVKARIEATGDLQTTVKFTFTECKWPFKMDKTCCALQISELCCTRDEKSCGPVCDYGSTVHPTSTYCVSYADDNDDFIIGHCPLSYTKQKRFKFSSLPNHTENFCNLRHTGVLCGQCMEDLSITVNTLRLECVNCSAGDVAKGWLVVLFVEFLPITITVLVIVIINLKLTQGIVSGFVLYCQLISVNFPGYYYPVWLALDRKEIGANKDTFFLGSIYSIPNLNFFFFLAPSQDWKVCIARGLTPLGSIAFWYVIEFYPLLLMLLLYLWLFLYGRGNKVVVRVSIPFHKCLARFWRFFRIQPSLVDSIASIYILVYAQLAATSMQLVDYSTWESLKYEGRTGRVFYYDASLNYFGWPHAVFGLFADMVLFFVLGLPMVFLLLYQFNWFRHCLRYCKLHHQLLISLADVFTGEFRVGRKATYDYRYFAGLYLLFRLATMSFIYIKIDPDYVLYSEAILSILFAGLIMIFRPYKKVLSNFIEFLIIMLLGIMSTLCLILNSTGRKICIYGLMHIPLILIILYAIYLVVKKVKKCKSTRKSDIMVQEVDADLVTVQINATKTDEEFPDRLLNPKKYNERHLRFTPADLDDSTTESEVSLQRVATDNQPLIVHGSTQVSDSDYGSTLHSN